MIFFSFSKTFSCFGGVKRAGNSPPESHNMGQNGEFISTFLRLWKKSIYPKIRD